MHNIIKFKSSSSFKILKDEGIINWVKYRIAKITTKVCLVLLNIIQIYINQNL